MTETTSPRIVVVGAGLSGLSAALLLDRAGYGVTVLEARANAGGRVKTLREPFADGLYAEAGAAYVSPGHSNVTRWCAHFGLELDPFPAPGEELANFPHHAPAEGRVHFAGEHTDLTAGMHGAIGSGERVAREIAERS